MFGSVSPDLEEVLYMYSYGGVWFSFSLRGSVHFVIHFLVKSINPSKSAR